MALLSCVVSLSPGSMVDVLRLRSSLCCILFHLLSRVRVEFVGFFAPFDVLYEQIVGEGLFVRSLVCGLVGADVVPDGVGSCVYAIDK